MLAQANTKGMLLPSPLNGLKSKGLLHKHRSKSSGSGCGRLLLTALQFSPSLALFLLLFVYFCGWLSQCQG